MLWVTELQVTDVHGVTYCSRTWFYKYIRQLYNECWESAGRDFRYMCCSGGARYCSRCIDVSAWGYLSYFYRSQGEGNVFTGVCLSTIGLMATRSLLGLSARSVRILLECFLVCMGVYAISVKNRFWRFCQGVDYRLSLRERPIS